MRRALVFVPLLALCIVGTVHAESSVFSVSFSKIYEEWMRDEPKHVNHLTINAFSGSVEYAVRVTNAETGAVVPSGSTVPQGTRLKLEFLPETMSWHTTGGIYDTPYAHWTETLPPAPTCDAADMVINQTGRKFNGKNSGNNIYAPVYAEPPAKTVKNVSALGSCTSPAVDGDTTCTASSIGTHAIDFEFAQTQAHQYVRVYRMDVSRDAPPINRWPKLNVCEPMGDLANIRDFAGAARNEPRSVVPLPKKSIPFTVTVIPVDPDNAVPAAPSLAAAGAGCTVGVPHSITFSATDPDGDQLRYLVDWNGDGTVDQFVSASGYVPSGVAQTASRTFATADRKTVQVRAQDDKGALSAPATLSFTCTGEPTSETAGLYEDADGFPIGDVTPIPSVNDLSLRALPSLVRAGNTTKVHWSSQNMSACTVSGTNGDGWNVLNSPVNGELSSAITGQVIYTLSCRGTDGGTYAKTAHVNVLPIWTEK